MTQASHAHPAHPHAKPVAKPGRTVRFRIKRCDGPGKPVRWETFAVKPEAGANIISCLQQIAASPVTVDGQKTTPVAWDSGCLE